MVLVGKIFYILEEVKEHKIYFINVGQLSMAHKFQGQFLNQVHKVSIIHHALHEWIYHILVG